MARLKGKHFVGALGDATLSLWRNIPVLKKRVKEGDIEQTIATQNAATTFGMGSSFGAALRFRLQTLHYIKDGTAVNRMNTVMAELLAKCRDKTTGNFDFLQDSFRPIEGFDLNINSPLRKSLQILPEVNLENGKLKVILPEAEVKNMLKFPDTASSCTIIVSVYMASLKTRHELSHLNDDTQTFTIDISEKHFEGREWNYDVPEGCYCVTSIALHYHRLHANLQVSLNNKTFCPAMICDFSVNPGKFGDLPAGWKQGHFAFEDGKSPLATKRRRKKKSGAKASAEDQKTETLQLKVSELEAKVAVLENFISNAAASIVQPEAQNAAFTAGFQTNLLNKPECKNMRIIPALSISSSANKVSKDPSGSLSHNNRGKPAA